MPKWEYIIVDCSMVNGTWRPKQINGNELNGWKSLSMVGLLASLGSEGWELVGFSHSTANEFWVFKRPQ